MKNPFVYIALPLYAIKFIVALVFTIFCAFTMAFGMLILGEDGSESEDAIESIWEWFKKGIF